MQWTKRVESGIKSAKLGLVLPACLAVPAFLAGCRGDSGAPVIGHVYEVKGKVLLQGDKPLDGGKIYFVRKDGSMTSEGKIASDGTFNLVTGTDEGAPEGEYKVRVEPDDPTLLSGSNLGRRAVKGGKKLPFSLRYLDEDSSGLIARVEPKPNQIEPFRLK